MLEVNNLKRQFGQKKQPFTAVADVSFQIRKGEIVALLGPNGVGKTTTVKMIARYLSPTAGYVINDGQDAALSPKLVQNQVATVFGRELVFYARASAFDNLKFFSVLFKIPRKERKKRIEEVLLTVQLQDVQNQHIGEFSRGMRQRLHIARALLKDTNIILLDEPTNGLDVEIAHEIRDLIRKPADNGKTILLTSHTMSEIESLADRVLLIGAGKIVHDGTVESVVKLSGVTKVNRPATLEEPYLALANGLRR